MAITRELFLAILSMDSYNRGYAAGIKDSGDEDPDGLGQAGSIGTATIGRNSSDLSTGTEPRVDIPAGFYAISYDLGGGKTVISYRGTDGLTLGTSPITGGSKRRVGGSAPFARVHPPSPLIKPRQTPPPPPRLTIPARPSHA